MKPVIQLVRVMHGSNLYGTNTPESDLDFKGVHLPDGHDIILQRPANVIDTSLVMKDEHGKNQKESVDNQSFSLQKFFEMLMKGDTVATEILFAPPPGPANIWTGAEGMHPDWPKIQSVGRQLINRQCKGFVGYCVRQAAKYGIKGSRMSAVHKLTEHLAKQLLGRTNTAKLSVIEDDLRAFTEGQEHMSWENIPHPDGKDCWHIVCCDRKMPMTASIREAFNIFSKVWENYGERARQAMNNEGIDWKAVSHAMRVAQQAVELLDTGRIVFPRHNAEFLRNIKLGVYDYNHVSAQLEEWVQEVHRASERSKLPEKSDHRLADAVVQQYYLGQING